MTKKENMKRWVINRFLRTLKNTKEEPIEDRKSADNRLDKLCLLAVIRAGLIGAISGMSISLLAYSLESWESKSDSNQIFSAVFIGVVGIIITSIELLILYRDSLNTAARMSKVLDIPESELSKIDIEQSLPRWLIYAAMGAPGYRGKLFGINPLEKIGKYGLFFRKILTKIRVVGSASLFKAIIRRIWVRMIGRVATRATVNLLALPVFIFLNMLGMRHTMNEMRSRLMGYELTPKIINHAFPEGFENLPRHLKKAIHEGFSEQIMISRYIHPNQIRILELLGDDIEGTKKITKMEQKRVDRFLVAISTMSGKRTLRHSKSIKKIENRLGLKETELVKKEVWDAIHDLKSFEREWT